MACTKNKDHVIGYTLILLVKLLYLPNPHLKNTLGPLKQKLNLTLCYTHSTAHSHTPFDYFETQILLSPSMFDRNPRPALPLWLEAEGKRSSLRPPLNRNLPPLPPQKETGENEQTNKETKKHTSTQTNEKTNKDKYKQRNKQNKQTKKQKRNKQTNKTAGACQKTMKGAGASPSSPKHAHQAAQTSAFQGKADPSSIPMFYSI